MGNLKQKQSSHLWVTFKHLRPSVGTPLLSMFWVVLVGTKHATSVCKCDRHTMKNHQYTCFFWHIQRELSTLNVSNEGCMLQSMSMLQCMSVHISKVRILYYNTQCSLSCSVLQCVAVCCSILQCVAVCYSVLQWVAVGYSQCASISLKAASSTTKFSAHWIAMRCSASQCVAVCCSVL